MKTNLLIFILFISMLVNCTKDEAAVIKFTPTDFIINEMGEDMRLSISGPFSEYYIFSGNDSMLNFTGENFICNLVSGSEMKKLANNLSDTLIFHWEVTTSVFPYPEDECKFRVTRLGYGDFMCSIGKGNTAIRIIQELSNSLTGVPRETFDEICNKIPK